MFRSRHRAPGSGDLQVATTKRSSDGFSRFFGYRTKQWGKKMRGKNMAFVTGEGSDSFVTHSFDSAPSPGPQTPCSESASSSPACPRHERFPLSRSPALPLSRID